MTIEITRLESLLLIADPDQTQSIELKRVFKAHFPSVGLDSRVDAIVTQLSEKFTPEWEAACQEAERDNHKQKFLQHACSGMTGTFATKYDQHAQRNGQAFTVLGVVDPTTYDAAECGEMFTIRFADGVQIVAWPEEVESALMKSQSSEAAMVALQVLEAIRATHPALIADNMPSNWGMNALRKALKVHPVELESLIAPQGA
jgi:hypothetical protein